MANREEQFEKMLAHILREYQLTTQKMDRLKAENRTRTATFRQLLGNKLSLQNMLSLYRLYGLIED